MDRGGGGGCLRGFSSAGRGKVVVADWPPQREHEMEDHRHACSGLACEHVGREHSTDRQCISSHSSCRTGWSPKHVAGVAGTHMNDLAQRLGVFHEPASARGGHAHECALHAAGCTGDCASGDFCGPSRTLIAVERPPQAATVPIAPMHTTPTNVQSLH